MQKIKQSLPLQIFIALGLGIVAGLILLSVGGTDFAINYIKPFGTIFLNLLKFIVVPIVITSIVCYHDRSYFCKSVQRDI